MNYARHVVGVDRVAIVAVTAMEFDSSEQIQLNSTMLAIPDLS